MNTRTISQLKQFDKEAQVVAFLGLVYSFGLLGIKLPLHAEFIHLTPFNLLLSLVIVLAFHPGWRRADLFFLLLCYVVGFGAELFGVQTGLLFGEYEYGTALGLKVWETPLIIGINWMLLAYSAGITANYLLPGASWWRRGIAGALSLVLLDLLIEPGAIKYGFWSWAGNLVPLRNYVGWFLVALPLQLYFAYFMGTKKNKVALGLFILQFIFFFFLSQ